MTGRLISRLLPLAIGAAHEIRVHWSAVEEAAHADVQEEANSNHGRQHG